MVLGRWILMVRLILAVWMILVRMGQVWEVLPRMALA
jgi:hypothetical protein